MKPGAVLIATVCQYEVTAILTGRVPTITALCRARPRPLRGLAIAVFTWWLTKHMLDDPGD